MASPRPSARTRSVKRTAREAPPRIRMESEARRGQLVELGITLFSTRPWDEVQIEDVAREARISKGLLYHYFPTKRRFYVAVVEETARRLLAHLEVPESLPVAVRLSTGLARYLEFTEQHAAAYVALMRGGIGSDPDVAAIVEGVRQTLLARIVAGAGIASPAAPLRLALRGWLGFVEATSVEWLEQRNCPREQLLALWSRVLQSMMA